MALQSATEYLRTTEQPPLGSVAIDSTQPGDTLDIPDFFAFGKQPAATRDAGAGERVGVIGAGDVWHKFIMPSLLQRGSEVFVYDKKFVPSCWIEKDPSLSPEEANANAAREREQFYAQLVTAGVQGRFHIVDSPDAMPGDMNYLMVLTPPSRHLDIIKSAMARNIPIAVEKPLVATREQADELEQMISEKPYPLYCIDWQVMHALPVLSACGLNVPFADAVETQVHDADAYARFKQSFDLKNVTFLDARFVEGGGNQLGDIETAMKTRPELFDYEKGGGILFDMAVHPMNVLAALGFKSTGVDEAYLGKPSRGAEGELLPGVYQRFGKESGIKSGETYGRALMRMGIEGGHQDIETVIEAAKGGAANDGRLILRDDHYELRWEMFPNEQSNQGSRLEIKELGTGKVIATSTMEADCYALILQDISQFAKSGSKAAPYLPEHAHMIRAIADIHAHARSQEIDKGDLVRQLKMDERPLSARVPAPRNALEPDGTGMSRKQGEA